MLYTLGMPKRHVHRMALCELRLLQAGYGGSPQDGRLHWSRGDRPLTIEDLVTGLTGRQRAPPRSEPRFSPFHTDSRAKPTRHKVSRASVSALGQRHRREKPESGTAETAPNRRGSVSDSWGWPGDPRVLRPAHPMILGAGLLLHSEGSPHSWL